MINRILNGEQDVSERQIDVSNQIGKIQEYIKQNEIKDSLNKIKIREGMYV